MTHCLPECFLAPQRGNCFHSPRLHRSDVADQLVRTCVKIQDVAILTLRGLLYSAHVGLNAAVSRWRREKNFRRTHRNCDMHFATPHMNQQSLIEKIYLTRPCGRYSNSYSIPPDGHRSLGIIFIGTDSRDQSPITGRIRHISWSGETCILSEFPDRPRNDAAEWPG